MHWQSSNGDGNGSFKFVRPDGTPHGLISCSVRMHLRRGQLCIEFANRQAYFKHLVNDQQRVKGDRGDGSELVVSVIGSEVPFSRMLPARICSGLPATPPIQHRATIYGDSS